MTNKILLTSMLMATIALSSCSDPELEKRVVRLEKEVEQLNARKLINNPNTASNPEGFDPNAKVPAMTFDKTIHDFGSIVSGEKVTHKFKFTNTGEGPLLIQGATASCGCTVPTWTKDPVEPGKTGEIVVEFDSKGKSGIQNKTVTVTANTQPSVNQLEIKVNVLVQDEPK